MAGYIFGHRHAHHYSFSAPTTHVLCASLAWNFRGRAVGYRIYFVYPNFTISYWKTLGRDILKYRITIPNPRRVNPAPSQEPETLSAVKPVREEGLVLHLKFDEGKGRVSADYSGHNNRVRVYGRDWTGTTWSDGVSGKAISLDGMDDYVDCGGSALFNIASRDLSISVWFRKADPEDTYQTILFKSKARVYKTPGYGLMLRETSPNLKFTLSDGEEVSQVFTPPILDTTWHHAVAVKEAKIVKIYLDGKLIDESPAPAGQISNSENLFLGKEGYGINPGGPCNTDFFCGLIDEVRIYRLALPAGRILELYREGSEALALRKN